MIKTFKTQQCKLFLNHPPPISKPIKTTIQISQDCPKKEKRALVEEPKLSFSCSPQPLSVMGFSSLSLLLIITTTSSLLFSLTAQHHHLDHLMRDYAFRCYTNHPKTAFLYTIPLPYNLSGIRAHTIRYRSGSLHRYGARIQQFRLAPGANVRPYVERLIIVQQHWGNWSSVYYKSTKTTSDFHLISPVLGLFAYDADNLTDPSGIEIFMEKPMTVDFSNVAVPPPENSRPLCAYFGPDGSVSVYNQSQSTAGVCFGFGQGHYGMVIKNMPEWPGKVGRSGGDGEISKWKVVIGSSIGGILVAMLLGLLCVALVKMKKKTKIAEMERRAYEEEALEVSMVGHFRAPTAPAMRTLPALENDYTP
ncbi:uncharacterized protein LOC131250135 [Magnolia sinica]|uniref:uncharacterized protein LOC131250135 n=1 Tax=Magnolia sinica TaxID=86752 RepID=UPI002658DEF7|nr:uncharacterized protein LOC131250135 [Magnolia sinica]